MEKELYEQLGVKEKINELKGLLTVFLDSMKYGDDEFTQALEDIINFCMEGFLSTTAIGALYEMIRTTDDPAELGMMLKSLVAMADELNDGDETSDLLNDENINTVC